MADEQNITVIRKKKIVGGHGGAHGGAWKVAYADFVTAMMAFFMVMWLMGSDEETKASVTAYFKDPSSAGISGKLSGGDASDRTEGASGRFEAKELADPSHTAPVYNEEYEVLKDLSTAFEGSAFTKDVVGDVVKYNLTPRIVFEEGSANVSMTIANRKLLVKLIEIFKQHDGTVVIEGYADKTQDWALAYGRALAVRRLMIDSEVVPNKLIPMAGFSQEDEVGRVIELDTRDRGTVRFILKRKRPVK